MRTKLAFKNTLISLLLQIVTAISGLIIPRFFTATYGSSINGLVSSISQFIVYLSLVEAGIGAAGIVQLYGPLVRQEQDEIDRIMSGARLFYRRSGFIFLFLVLLLAGCYPRIISHEIADTFFIRSMILVLSVNGIVDYFILGKYRMLLVADQKNYVVSQIQIIGVLLTMIVSITLIKLNANPLLVKMIVAIIYLLRTALVVYYVRKNYPELNMTVLPKKEAFKHKSSALLHQVVGMICNNTDLVLLTILLKNNALVQVSIYSVYNLVAYALTSLLESIAIGLRAAFGQIISENQKDLLQKSYSQFEFLYINLLFVVYTCMGVLMFSFITLYSQDFEDASLYTSWPLVWLFTLIGLVQNLRIPGSTIQVAAGHFKETQVAAVLEASINLTVSLVLIFKFGIVGVLIGTLCSYLYRTSYVIYYTDRNFIENSLSKTLFRIFRSGLIAIIIGYLLTVTVTNYAQTWQTWVLSAIVVFLVSSVGLVGVNSLFEPQVVRDIISRFRT